MTLKRVLLAVLAGAVVMFAWGAVSHLLLFKGTGFSRLPNQDRVLAELRASIPEDGLYFFPSPDFSGNAPPEETASWEARFRAGPTGMLVYHPSGSSPVSGRKLLVQFLSHLMGALVATFIVSLIAARPYWIRVFVVGLLGAFGPLTLGMISWNWYGFPTPFFLAQCVDMLVGWSLSGAVIAIVVRPWGSARRLGQSSALCDDSSGGQPSS